MTDVWPKGFPRFPAYPADRLPGLARRIAALLGTANEIALFGAEAVVALESVAASLGGPGVRAVNVVTSPYGRLFGDWLRREGAAVRDVVAPDGLPVDPAAVAEALAAEPAALVVLAHGEAASGIVNPLEEIAELARAHGALLVVDAVASVGGHRLAVDELGADVVVIGPQKAIGGPPSVSAVSVSARAWHRVNDRHRGSILDLGAARPLAPVPPDPAVLFGLEAALGCLEHEGIAQRIERHALAARAARAGVAAAGGGQWAPEARASALVTAAAVPDGTDPATFLREAQRHDPSILAGVGGVASRVVRLNHTGDRAAFGPVVSAVTAYALARRQVDATTDVGAAADAAAAFYA